MLSLFVLVTTNVCACIPKADPLARSHERIKERFDSVDTVVTAQLIQSKKTTVQEGGINFDLRAETDTFVVTRSFKGKLRRGDRFVLTTVLGGCSISAVNDPPWVQGSGVEDPSESMKEWLIYMNSKGRTQLTYSEMTRPLGMVAVDLPFLRKLRKGN
jgi:hypothetical protein